MIIVFFYKQKVFERYQWTDNGSGPDSCMYVSLSGGGKWQILGHVPEIVIRDRMMNERKESQKSFNERRCFACLLSLTEFPVNFKFPESSLVKVALVKVAQKTATPNGPDS